MKNLSSNKLYKNINYLKEYQHYIDNAKNFWNRDNLILMKSH